MLPLGEPFVNRTRRRLQAGEKLLGAWAQLASPMSAEILARGGFDFLLIDHEHAPGDILSLIGQLQGMRGFGADALVRAPWNDFVAVKRILDAGAGGIHMPYVNTAEEARAAVRAALYPPEGIRGIAGSPRACGYGLGGREYYENANGEILIYVALETPQAIENLGEMMEIERLDGIFIGPMDLATSMGYLGNPGHPEVQEAIRSVEQRVIGSGKFLGTVAGSYEIARELFGRGYQYVVGMSDSGELSQRSHAMVQRFREDFPAG